MTTLRVLDEDLMELLQAVLVVQTIRPYLLSLRAWSPG